MKELLERRSYTRKVFDLDGGKQLYRFHTAHKHFKNDRGEFDSIDTSLSFMNGRWRQSKASYHCSIPEYADDWFEFYNAYEGANHTIKAKPVASHVKGEAFSGNDGHGVIYKDAFGKGIDLKVYAYWHGLKKVIIINEKPSEFSDMSFDFEMQLPNTKVKDRAGNEWNKSSKLDFKDKTLKIGEDGKESYFHNAMMWDSGNNRENVNIELYTKDGKTYLRKTIPKEFLEKATYPVYTDHPTNYSPTAGDGKIGYGLMGSWDECHDATAGYTVEYTGTTDIDISVVDMMDIMFDIVRAFIPIDTSGIDDSATVSSASLFLYYNYVDDYDNDGDDWVNLVQTSQNSTSSLTGDDFDQCGSVDNPTEGATRKDLGSITGGYNSWALNATGIGWINKAGITKLGMREGHDCIDSPMYSAGAPFLNRATFYSSEDTSGTKDPYLDVTVGAAETNVNVNSQSLSLLLKTIALTISSLFTSTKQSLSLALKNPTFTLLTPVNVSTLQSTLTLKSPSIKIASSFTTTISELNAVLKAPVVKVDCSVSTSTLPLTITFVDSTVISSCSFTDTVHSLSFTLGTSTYNYDFSLSVDVQELTLSLIESAVSLITNSSVNVLVQQLIFSLQEPTFEYDYEWTATVLSSILTLNESVGKSDFSFDGTVFELAFTLEEPTYTYPFTVYPNTLLLLSILNTITLTFDFSLAVESLPLSIDLNNGTLKYSHFRTPTTSEWTEDDEESSTWTPTTRDEKTWTPHSTETGIWTEREKRETIWA